MKVKTILLMKFLILLTSAMSHAGELVITKGVVQKNPRETRSESVDRAKRTAYASLPQPNMIQHSPWAAYAAGSGGSGYIWASATAAFSRPGDTPPWFIKLGISDLFFGERSGVPARIEDIKTKLLKSARFYCNSEVEVTDRWHEKISEDPAPYKIDISASFQCT